MVRLSRDVFQMNSVKAFSYFGIFLLLLGYYLISERRLPETEQKPTTQKRIVDFSVADLSEIVLKSGDLEIRAVRSNDQWKVTEPTNSVLSPDLIPSLLDSLLGTEPVERLGVAGKGFAEFGLDRSVQQIQLRRGGHPPVTVWLGVPNPSHTAVYARIEGSDDVLLLGLNVEYYFELATGRGGTTPALGVPDTNS